MIKDEMLKHLLKRLEQEYGDLDSACGCTVLCKDGQYRWLSLEIIKNIIDEVDRKYAE